MNGKRADSAGIELELLEMVLLLDVLSDDNVTEYCRTREGFLLARACMEDKDMIRHFLISELRMIFVV
jgi:hypothetical protein